MFIVFLENIKSDNSQSKTSVDDLQIKSNVMPRSTHVSEPIIEEVGHSTHRKSSREGVNDHNSLPVHSRKTSNPESSINSDNNHQHQNSYRTRSHTLPTNELRKHMAKKSETDDSPLNSARRSQHRTSGSQDHVANSIDQSHTSVGNKAPHASFRERSNTLPTSTVISSGQQSLLSSRTKPTGRTSNNNSNDNLHSPTNGSRKDLSKSSNSNNNKFVEISHNTTNNKKHVNKDNGLSAEQILDTYIQQVSTFHKHETLPIGSDIFEEVRGELWLEQHSNGDKSAVNSNSYNVGPPKLAKTSSENHGIRHKAMRVAFDSDMAKTCSAPNSPGLLRRVHFKAEA